MNNIENQINLVDFMLAKWCMTHALLYAVCDNIVEMLSSQCRTQDEFCILWDDIQHAKPALHIYTMEEENMLTMNPPQKS